MLGAHVVFASPIRWTRLGRFRHFRLIAYCWNNYTSLCSTISNKSRWAEDMQWRWYEHETTNITCANNIRTLETQIFSNTYQVQSGPGSSVGIATELRAGRSGIKSWWGRDFLPVHTGPGAHPASCKMGTGSFPGVKCGRGVLLTTHPLIVPRPTKSRATPLPTLWATPGL